MRISLMFLFSFMVSFSVSSQEISMDQWSLVSKKTADWCSRCGTWGWTLKNQLLEDNADKNVLVWSVHSSGGLQTATSSAITANLMDAGQPLFFLNEDNMVVSSSNIQAKREEINLLAETLSAFPPFAGVGSEAIFDGTHINLTSKATFFQDLEGGNYWLSAYLMQKELISSQAAVGPDAVHKNVLRHALTEGDFGENILNGPVGADESFTVENAWEVPQDMLNEDFSSNFSVVTILWVNVNGEYKPFNLNVQDVSEDLSSVDELDNSITVQIGTFDDQGLVLVIENLVDSRDLNIELISSNGATVATKSAFVTKGFQQIEISTMPLPAGVYYIHITDGISKKTLSAFKS